MHDVSVFMYIFAQVNTVLNDFSETYIYMVKTLPLSAGLWGAFALCLFVDNGCGV